MDKNNIPKHIAIIMDGNGRWASSRHLPKSIGHRYGARSAENIISECANLGVKALTLYSFSSENWKRPEKEIKALMQLLHNYLTKTTAKLQKNNIKLNVIGRINKFPAKVREALKISLAKTAENKGMILTLALNYGGRQEIIDACKKISKKVLRNKIKIKDIDENIFSSELYTKNLPELDMVIRTSGEKRISNFLLWQISYAEFINVDIFWPDFKPNNLREAIAEYQTRNRRFGARA